MEFLTMETLRIVLEVLGIVIIVRLLYKQNSNSKHIGTRPPKPPTP